MHFLKNGDTINKEYIIGGIILDELEKNGVPFEDEAETQAENTHSVSEDEKLKEELEDLRDMFQSELDKAMNEEEDETDSEQMLIQELDEIEEITQEENEEEKEIKYCEYCGENPTDTSFGEDYPYCSECRKKMKANPLNAVGAFMLLFILLLAGYSFGNMISSVDTYITLLNADSAYTSRKLTDAATYYQTYISSLSSDDAVSMRAVKNAALTMADLGYYSDANTIVETYFSESSLSRKSNEKYANIKTEYTVLMNTSNLINDNFGETLNGEDFDYDEEIKKADSLIEEYKDNPEYNYTFLEYAKYLIMLIDGKSDEVLIKQLQKIEEVDGGKHPWIYLTYLLNTYGNLGETEKADEVFKKCLEINIQETSLYNYYANAYRFCETPDADKIIEIAQQAQQNGSSSAYPVYYRSYAIGYLFEGEYDKAMQSMESYLSSCSPTVADYNLYALCAVATEDTESYDEAESTLSYYGYEFSNTVKKYKKGKITLVEALTDREGQI